MQKKVVVILSGGMDSSLVAFKMAKLGYQLITVHFSYGQRTENREKFLLMLFQMLLMFR